MRQKNSSQNSMHANSGLNSIQHRENFFSAQQTPSANLQGFNSHNVTIDHDGAVGHGANLRGSSLSNPHRRGNSNNVEIGRSPSKMQPGSVSLKYAN